MAAQELTFRIGANDAALKSVLADVRNQYGRTITEITNQTKAVASQMNAIWAARTREINAELSKQAQVEKAHASVEVETARATQREVAAAYSQRQREVEAKAKSEVAAWVQHEAQKVAATRNAEKQGEAAVVQSNAAKVRATKQAEDARTSAARAASAERARLERASESLQKQRSSALIAIWKAEERERVRIAREAHREIERAEAESQRRRQSFIGGAIGGVTALLGVSAVSEIRNAASAMLDYASTLETTRIAFTQMLGSAQLAEQHLKELQAFALKTPFQFTDLIDASQRMQALGFNAQQVIPILTDVGNAVAAAGGGAERLDRVVLALSQVQSKGKVATQELNQLAEAGIPGWKILEQQIGKSRAELVKMVEDGKVSSAVFLEAFQKFSQQNFGGLMEAQSKTFSGAMSNIKDALLQTSATAFEPLYARLTETALRMSELSKNSEEFKDKLQVAGSVIVTIFDGIVEAVHVVKDAIALVQEIIIGTISAWTHAFFALANAARSAMFAIEAIAKFAAGDFVGGVVAAERSQQQLQRSIEELGEAYRARMGVFREMGRIWEEAGQRARNAASDILFAQAAIGTGNAGFLGGLSAENIAGAGVFRKAQPTTTETESAKKAKGADPARAEQRLAVLELQRTLANIAEEERATERSLKNRQIMFEAYAEAVELKEAQRHMSTMGGLLAETLAAEKLRDAKQREIQLYEIENKRIEERNRHQAAKDKLDDARAKIQGQVAEFIKDQNEAVREAIEGAKGHIAITEDAIAALEREGAIVTERQKHWLLMNAAILANVEARKMLIESIERLGPLLASEGEGAGLGDDAIAALAGAKADAAAGLPPLPDAEEFSARQTAITAGLDVMREGFAGLADAANSAIDSFIKFGTAGTGFRKFVAEIISGIARIAVTKAIFHLAEGFAALAFAFFGMPQGAMSAAAHFQAAALYGAIAGVAAIAGRVTAGGAFTQESGGTASGAFNSSTGGGRGGSGSSTAPKPMEADRRSYSTQPIVRELRLTVNGDAVIDRFVEDFDLNGRTRIIVSSGG